MNIGVKLAKTVPISEGTLSFEKGKCSSPAKSINFNSLLKVDSSLYGKSSFVEDGLAETIISAAHSTR